MIPFYFVAVRKDNQIVLSTHLAILETVALIALGLMAAPQIYRRDPAKLRVIGLIGAVLALLQLPYLVFYHRHPLAGTTVQYLVGFGRLYLFLIGMAIYALLFLREEFLVTIFWRVGQFIIVVSLAAYLLAVLIKSTYLVNLYGDQTRIQGFFTEPSAFAPMLAAFVLIGLKKRSVAWLVFAFIAVLLTGSPTVYLTVAISVPLASLVFRKQLGRRTVLVTGAVTGIAVIGLVVATFDASALSLSHSGIARSIGKLGYGLQDVFTLGGSGGNLRFAGALDLFRTMQQHNLWPTGYGLNSSAVYFLAVYGEPKDHSLFLTVLFSYGLLGLAVFCLLCAGALYGLSKAVSPYLYLFLPFLIASSINSAEGFETYKFVIVGLLAYGLGRGLTRESPTSQGHATSPTRSTA